MENVGQYDSGDWRFKLRRCGPPRIKMPNKPRARLYFQPGTFISRPELATICRVHRHTVRFWILRGWTPPQTHQRGARMLWRSEDLNAWDNAIARKYLKAGR